MRPEDKTEFDVALCGVLELNDKPVPSEAVIDIWMDALRPYSLQQVTRALTAHVKKSKFAPKPADIIEVINLQDGRPSSDEAWPIALKASDESATAVWTEEIEQAWFHCLPVFEQGDEVGARMTFRQFYDRLVSDARSQGIAVKWNVSLGHDPDLRKKALVQAETQGLIAHERIEHLLPAPEPEGDGQHVAAIIGYDKKPEAPPSADVAANIAKLRNVLAKPTADRKAQKAEQRKAIEAKRREKLEQQEKLLIEARKNHQKEATHDA